ncbi:hypothetical protein Tco_0617230 [Tanacetum coccineum]
MGLPFNYSHDPTFFISPTFTIGTPRLFTGFLSVQGLPGSTNTVEPESNRGNTIHTTTGPNLALIPLLGVQTQSHIGKIIISELTYKLGGLLLLSPIGFRMEPQLGLYVRVDEMLGLGSPTSGIRARLGPVVVWMVFPRLDPGSTVLVDPGKPCTERKPVKRRGVPMVKVGDMKKVGSWL